ncbi:MAG: alpha-2-macroglobulin family protein [Acetobacteraceae bacterium]
MLRRLLVVPFVLLALTAVAAAQPLDLPGLDTDASRYQRTVEQARPAGAPEAVARRAFEQAQQAAQRGDWPAAVAAEKLRAAADSRNPAPWLSLAQALMKLAPPDSAHALDAAWLAFQRTAKPEAQLPVLEVMEKAAAALKQKLTVIEVLEAMVARAPKEPKLAERLKAVKREYGLLVRRVHTDADAFPTRACIAFTGPAGGSRDFQPGDWVTVSPRPADLAVTLESGQICLSGLPAGKTTKVALRAGMPAADGTVLQKSEVVPVALPDRSPQLAFNSEHYLLPREQAPELVLSSVNLSAVNVQLVRVSERNVLDFLSNHPPGSRIDYYDARDITRNAGQLVWHGKIGIPGYRKNALLRSVLKLPADALTGGVGLYALIAMPGDGTPFAGKWAEPVGLQLIVRTDLAPTVWRATDELTVSVRGYAHARVRAGVGVDLLAANNEILAHAVTNADGIARFAAPLMQGEHGLGPKELHFLAPGGDFTLLRLDRPAFDLADRGVSGPAPPGPLDAFMWLDRGIYRPGETVRIMALLRNSAGRPIDLPVHVIVRRPNGQVFSDTVPPRRDDDSLYDPLRLSAGAQSGVWEIDVATAPDTKPIARETFQVEAFVPPRLAVDLGKPSGELTPGKTLDLPISVRFLYGAPGSGLTGSAQLRLQADPEPFPAFTDYRFGLTEEQFNRSVSLLTVPETDARGDAVLPLEIADLPDSTHPLEARLAVEINDPAGRAVAASTSIRIAGRNPLIGLKPLFAEGAVNPGEPATFDVVALDPMGKRIAMAATVELVRREAEWRLATRNGAARYQIAWRDVPVFSQRVTIPADRPYHFSRSLGFGEYRIELVQHAGMAATSYDFAAGWGTGGSPDVPEKVGVTAGRAEYAPGSNAVIHIDSPFAGPASLLVLTDRVVSERNIVIPAGGVDKTVTVGADWGPGAYVAVHVYRPADEKGVPGLPRRAIGLTWIKVDPAARVLHVSIEAAKLYRPRQTVVVDIRTAPGAYVTLAAVDEGILRLTQFKSPDPLRHFFGQRGLGVDILDAWGRLIPPAEGTNALLETGGGENFGASGPPVIPQRVVALFSPPVEAGKDGIARVALTLPDFNGQLRLMAVAWRGDQVGQADTKTVVRDKLIAEVLLPRFLAPGDDARLAVLLENLDLPAGPVIAELKVSGALALTGPDRLEGDLAPGERVLPYSELRAVSTGTGTVALNASGPGGFTVTHRLTIAVHPVRPRTTSVQATKLKPGEETEIAAPEQGFLPGTWTATTRFGGAVAYDVAAVRRALENYPWGCLEQTVSRGFGLLFPENGHALAGGKLAQAAQAVLDDQRYDGSFGLWSAEGEAQPWLSAYATDFLLRARARGVFVPELAVNSALSYLADLAAKQDHKPAVIAAQAYAVYVLALAGRPPAGAIRVLAARPDALPTPLARAEVGAALARLAEPDQARALLSAALAQPKRRFWSADYGSTLRDLLATTVLAADSGVMGQKSPQMIGRLPGPDLQPDQLNTQEQAWALAAANALAGGARETAIALDGRTLKSAGPITVALRGKATARNLGSQPIWQIVSVTGIPAAPAVPASQGMAVSRRFFTLEGSPLDPAKLMQNTVFVMLLQGSETDGQDHQAMVVAGLPAGWEIAGRFHEGKVPGMAWLGSLSGTAAQFADDDRFAAAIELRPGRPDFRVAVMLRAVTVGSYQLPGPSLVDMYRPGVFARGAAGRVAVATGQ